MLTRDEERGNNPRMPHTYFVTGASRGIGLEICRQLLASGNRVIATTRTRESAMSVVELGAHTLELDVSDGANITTLASRVPDAKIDVLINIAGVSSTSKTLGDCDAAELQRVFMVNSIAPILVARALLPKLLAGERKVIVNITSQLGSITNNTGGSSYAYRASKAALNMLTVSLSNELRPQGFTCYSIHPGWVKTDMGGPAAPLSVQQSAEFILRNIEKSTQADSGQFKNYDGTLLPW